MRGEAGCHQQTAVACFEAQISLVLDSNMLVDKSHVEGLSGKEEQDAGQGITLARPIPDGDQNALPAVDLHPGKVNQCILVECLDNVLFDPEGPEHLEDDLVPYLFKSIFNFKAGKLERLLLASSLRWVATMEGS